VTGPRPPSLVLAAAVVAAVGVPAARAQMSASFSLTTDYRFRGASLSDRRPAAALNFAYDDRSGVYAGGSLLAQDASWADIQSLGSVVFLGYAARAPAGLSWDVGVKTSRYTPYVDHRYKVDYDEVYLGLSDGHVAARLSYSPNYLKRGAAAAYLDLSGAFHPRDRWRLSGHVGMLAPVGGDQTAQWGRDYYDVQAGITREFGRAELGLDWSMAAPKRPFQGSLDRGAVTANAVFFF
jgi:uncharacterized protein (TIGR02001 family)